MLDTPRLFRVRTLLNSLLAVGAFFILGTASAFAAAGDFNVTGGDTLGGDATIPVVGNASETLGMITISSNGGDDIADTESFDIAINTVDYPSLAFDNSVTVVTIGGTFGATGTPAVTYNGSKTIATFTLLTGGGDDANGETVTVSGLKIASAYAMNATSNKSLIQVDANTSSNNTFRPTTNTISQPVNAGTLTGVSVAPASTSVGATGNVTVNFTSTASIPQQGKIVVTFPNGFDLTDFGTSQTPILTSGLTAANWTATRSGQVVTLTENNTSNTSGGTKSFTLQNIRNPSSTGSTNIYTVVLTIGAGNEIQKDVNVPASTIVGNTVSVTVGTPTGLTAENQDGAVVLNWNDPDDDTTEIQILKGTDPLPVNGTVYATVAAGVETFVDEDVEEGDVVTYQLRAYGSGRTGTLTDEVTLTVSFTSDSDDTVTDEEDTSDENDTTTDDTTDENETTDDTSDDEDTTDEMEEVEFTDTDGHWAQWEIQVMAEAGVAQGNPDGSFSPDGNLNRAEAAAILWRIYSVSEPSDPSKDPFEDVDMDAWYAGYVAGLKDLGIVEGNPDGTYEPSEEINRAEFLQMSVNLYLYLMDGMQEEADSIMASDVTDAYEDLDTSAWYAELVTLATEWEFVSGSECDGGMCFNAGASITRAEAIKILYNMYF